MLREADADVIVRVCGFGCVCISTVANPLWVTSFEQSANYHILSHLGFNNCHTTPPPPTLAAARIHGNSVKQGTMETATLCGGWWEMVFRLRRMWYLIPTGVSIFLSDQSKKRFLCYWNMWDQVLLAWSTTASKPVDKFFQMLFYSQPVNSSHRE